MSYGHAGHANIQLGPTLPYPRNPNLPPAFDLGCLNRGHKPPLGDLTHPGKILAASPNQVGGVRDAVPGRGFRNRKEMTAKGRKKSLTQTLNKP